MSAPSSSEVHESPAVSPSSPYPLQHTDSDPDTRHTHSPRTPSSASLDVSLLPDVQPRTPQSHTVSPSLVSSPLNPNAQISGPPSLFMGPRVQSNQNVIFIRVASEESQALASQHPSVNSNRASMILYRLAGEEKQHAVLPRRPSVLSSSGDSVFTVSYDSKYPFGAYTPHKLVPFPFDPTLLVTTPEDDDPMHDPADDTPLDTSGITIRGIVNIGVLVLVILALLCLFILYPVWHFYVKGNSTIP